MKTKFITYGFEYNPEKWREIKNRRFCGKPDGGLWGSPVDSSWGWKDWCDSEDFRQETGFNSGFTWELSDPSRILILDCMKTYQELPGLYKIKYLDEPFAGGSESLNFERISQDYDAILLTENGLDELRGDFSLNFYSWDCESIIALNRNAIINIESITKNLTNKL